MVGRAVRSTRYYASIASGRGSSNDIYPTLEHFMLRAKTLHLWRACVRATNKISIASNRAEMLDLARAEFERNRNITDLSHIRYLLSTGKTQFDSMARYIEQNSLKDYSAETERSRSEHIRQGRHKLLVPGNEPSSSPQRYAFNQHYRR